MPTHDTEKTTSVPPVALLTTFADGTEITLTQTPDGKTTGGVTAADGRHGVLPDEFFTHPALTTVGGALTWLEEQAKRGIPMLSPQSVDNLGKAGKYGGPTLGVATALYDTVTAKTFHDGCVSAISGAAGVGGGYATGALAAAGITALGNPELAPVFAMGGDIAGGLDFRLRRRHHRRDRVPHMKLLPLAILCALLFGPLGILSAVWAVVSIGRGEYLTAVVSIGFAMLCLGFIIPFAKTVPGKVCPRGDFDDEGTTIRPDRGIDIPIQVALLGLVVAGGLFAVFAPLGTLDIPVPEQMRLYLPFIGSVAAVAGAPILWRTLRRGSSKYLRLTPDGLAIVQGWRPQSGDWAQVADVTDVTPSQSAPMPSAVVAVMSDGNALTLSAASFTPDGRDLRELVRFYWLHTDRRDELTDGRALKRLTDGRFAAGS